LGRTILARHFSAGLNRICQLAERLRFLPSIRLLSPRTRGNCPTALGERGHIAPPPREKTSIQETCDDRQQSREEGPGHKKASKVAKPAAEKNLKAKKEPKSKKPSALDAAAKVLSEAGAPMNCQEMVKAMVDKGYWSSPEGKTPHATLYSAILREINVKGKEARFVKTERGNFALVK